MISANDRRRILAKLIHARHALAQHPVHVGKQIKCSRCGSLLPISSRLAQKNKMQAQLLHNLLHGAALPTSRLLERGRIHI